MIEKRKPLSYTMRILHRYIGFFLAGIMGVYALSGIVLIFRETNFLKQAKQVEKTIAPNADPAELGKMLGVKNLKISKTSGDTIYFENGSYNKATGTASYTTRELPRLLSKLTKLHKASTKQPLYWLNIFFGVSLLFFVVSSFWMFRPDTKIFRKGIYFTIAGIVLTLILLFL
jgi:hypothetical protein